MLDIFLFYYKSPYIILHRKDDIFLKLFAQLD